MLEPILQGESQWGVNGNNQYIKDDDEGGDLEIDAKGGDLWDGWDD